MIIDALHNFGEYFHGLEDIGEILAAVQADAKEGRYELSDEGNIFLNVSRYHTRERAQCKPETHVQYVDIQYVAAGQEIIEHFPLEGLSTAIPYDEEKDISFYQTPEPAAASRILLKPGRFAVFFPQDAHMPGLQLTSGTPEEVLKVVIKIRLDLL